MVTMIFLIRLINAEESGHVPADCFVAPAGGEGVCVVVDVVDEGRDSGVVGDDGSVNVDLLGALREPVHGSVGRGEHLADVVPVRILRPFP